MIIGVTGNKGSGKDSFAKIFIENGWVELKFAGKVKDAVYELNPLVPYFHGQHDRGTMTYRNYLGLRGIENAKENPEVRRLLQYMGTEVGRNLFGENFWVDQTMKEACELVSEGKDVIITDVRFQNEVDIIQAFDNNSSVIRVLREGHGDGEHTSERCNALQNISIDVYNNGTLADLAQKGYNLLGKL